MLDDTAGSDGTAADIGGVGGATGRGDGTMRCVAVPFFTTSNGVTRWAVYDRDADEYMKRLSEVSGRDQVTVADEKRAKRAAEYYNAEDRKQKDEH
jgi:hypothetical protein